MMKNGNKLPDKEVLKDIPGLAFIDDKHIPRANFNELSKNPSGDSLNI